MGCSFFPSRLSNLIILIKMIKLDLTFDKIDAKI